MARITALLFKIARSKPGGPVARWGLARANKLIPMERINETDLVIAFQHPAPTHEFHVLLVPKESVKSLSALEAAHGTLLAEVFQVVKQIVEEKGLEKIGYSLLVNGGLRQDVPQLHFHLIAGEEIRPSS